jgi:iron-sulfur cluster assembly protein
MVTVTESAVTQLRQIMEDQNMENVGVRVFVRGQCGCGAVHYGMGFDDAITEEDDVFDHNGVAIVIDREAAPKLDGATIDFIESDMRQGFAITNPNSQGCGCGGH